MHLCSQDGVFLNKSQQIVNIHQLGAASAMTHFQDTEDVVTVTFDLSVYTGCYPVYMPHLSSSVTFGLGSTHTIHTKCRDNLKYNIVVKTTDMLLSF